MIRIEGSGSSSGDEFDDDVFDTSGLPLKPQPVVKNKPHKNGSTSSEEDEYSIDDAIKKVVDVAFAEKKLNDHLTKVSFHLRIWGMRRLCLRDIASFEG